VGVKELMFIATTALSCAVFSEIIQRLFNTSAVTTTSSKRALPTTDKWLASGDDKYWSVLDRLL